MPSLTLSNEQVVELVKQFLSLVKYQDIAIAKATDFVNLFS